MNKKQFISLILTLAMTLTLAACNSSESGGMQTSESTLGSTTAPETTAEPLVPCSAGLAYEVNPDGKTCTITGIGSCKDTDIVIGDYIEDYNVTAIAPQAFWNNETIVSVVIYGEVQSIGALAFGNCTNMKKIILDSDCIISLSKDCFGGPSIEYNEYDNAYYLGNEQNPYLYLVESKSNDITSCNINENTKIICRNAFYSCKKLISVTIPDGVTNINGGAFFNCESLSKVELSEDLIVIGYEAFLGCMNITEMNLPEGLENIGEAAFCGCRNLTTINIPDSVKYIGGEAFSSCHKLKYNEYDNAYYLGNDKNPYVCLIEAKSDDITSCTINSNSKLVCDNAFENCKNLSNIIIPDSVTFIGYAAFEGCKSISNITIPDSVTFIGSAAFKGCKSISNITIPDGVTIIEAHTFSGCYGLNSITMSDRVTNIEERAFEYCENLSNITIPNSVTSIGENVFDGCTSLVDITIPNSVTSIGENAFKDCASLTSITIPDSVAVIGREAFQNCTSLVSINLGKGIKVIDYNAFNGCAKLEKICISDIESWLQLNTSSYDGIFYDGVKLLVNGELLTQVEVPETIIDIGDGVFGGYTYLTEVKFSDSITNIGDYAFSECTGLTEIIIPGSVTSIGEGSFVACTAIISITIPNSVKNINMYAFYGCTALKDITFTGTKAEWAAIAKGEHWDDETGNYIIHCTDGDITK